MRPPIFLLTLHLALLASTVIAKEACEEPSLVFTDVRVFDGHSVIPQATVVTGCTTISRIANSGEPKELPADAVIIDGSGKTLLPGLIDTHTHIWSRPMLERPLDFGVTTVMDMGSANLDFADSIKAERASGPARDRADLYSAVVWATAPGSHGTQFGEVPTLVQPADAAPFVTARAEDGADFIKIIYDNFKMFDADIPTLNKETMEAVVAAAHERGMMAVAHSRDVQAWADVAMAGVDGIVHLPVDEVPDADLIALLKEKGIWIGANLSLNRPTGDVTINDPALGPKLTEPEKENLKKFRALHREGGDQVALDTLAALHAAGIMILPGSDTPNGGTTAGATMHIDIAMLVHNGFTPLEALRSATADAAAAFGLMDRGRIAEGLQADLLLVEGQPDRNIEDTRNIVAVVKAGKVHFNRPASTQDQ
jgi:imidazolonepropionase-like amidohydrolase